MNGSPPTSLDLKPAAATKADFADAVAAEYARAKPLMKFIAEPLKLKF